jgi:hypothetical protein
LEGENALLTKNGAPALAGILLAFLAIHAQGMTAMPDNFAELFKVLPKSIDGWTKSETPAVYTPETLSDYIDGGAELYLSYNFKGALSVMYTDKDDNEIILDIFDMGSSFDAFGVFAHSRETIGSAFGQGSEYAAGLLTFWKDRYYVSIQAYPETPAKKDVVFELGRAVAGAIPAEGALPPILALLPQENLIPESVHFFHHYVWLNSFYFVSNENVLDIAADTPAALGKYREGGSTYFLLVVRYPDAARAEAAEALFKKKMLGAAQEGLGKLEDGRWAGMKRLGDLAAVVFGAPDAGAVKVLLEKIKA